MRGSRSFAAGILTLLLLAACSSDISEPGVVLEAWIDAAFEGDPDASQTYIASDDIPWIGLGASPEAFAAGSAPFQSTNIVSECRSDHTLGRCETTWTDLWIDAIPELDEGFIRITAEVEDGKIVAFREWVFSPEVVSASGQHVDWLELYEPEKLEAACGADIAAAECSQLLVDTVGMWVADR